MKNDGNAKPAGESAERKRISGRAVPLRGNDIDTDRIIPARYLKCVTFEELGKYAFYDERFDVSGAPRAHAFNDDRYAGHEILLVNRNFGCGSSREHAPQSLMRTGIRAIIGESFAEIFSGNCTSLGIPAVVVEEESAVRLFSLVEKNPETVLTVDLEAKIVRADSTGTVEVFPLRMNEASRQSLASGSWDTTGSLLSAVRDIRRTAGKLPYLNSFVQNASVG